MIIMASTLINAINNVRHITPEEIEKDNIVTFTNCRTYNTGLYKPNTLAIENNQRLISIVYYDRKNVIDKMRLYAIATDEKGNKYDVYTEEHENFTGYLAFPQDPEKIKGLYPWA